MGEEVSIRVNANVSLGDLLEANEITLEMDVLPATLVRVIKRYYKKVCSAEGDITGPDNDFAKKQRAIADKYEKMLELYREACKIQGIDCRYTAI